MACVLLAYRWPNINFLILADTDDNLRLAQVKAWLAGQNWYDLRQYKLDPPHGADIHWSRLPDMPIAGLISLFSPILGALWAERLALAVAPLVPFGLALWGLGLTARRLVHPIAWLFAAVLLFSAPSAMGMFLPMRIDHHGWQLAFLALALAGLADPDARRGGLVEQRDGVLEGLAQRVVDDARQHAVDAREQAGHGAPGPPLPQRLRRRA